MIREKDEASYAYVPENCPRQMLDNRGSTRATRKYFCKQCGSFVDEVTQEFAKKRDAGSGVVRQTATDRQTTAVERGYARTRDDRDSG